MAQEPANPSYKVLARSYRPQTFSEMVGQDVLVKTLTNAIESGRLPHAYILTGIRGVGKTTSARILAKGLNCVGSDGAGGPTASPCGVCENCLAITQDRHVDVLEMDAASRTGVDDIRELIEGVQYKATQSRYKVYIIDEVHMLSKNAFNALLKTLEEPPAHVKFIFATTEIRKVPPTILSRCQRFDLRRIEAADLVNHFRAVLDQEGAPHEEEALNLIARAADGSARDGMSLLEQALVVTGERAVRTGAVRDMLGLADGGVMLDLFCALVEGQVAQALDLYEQAHKNGADPKKMLEDLTDLTHWLTILKSTNGQGAGMNRSQEFVQRGLDVVSELSVPILTRLWQILLKGLQEIREAPCMKAAGEMVMIRLCYVSKMPTPDQLMDLLKNTPVAPPLSSPALVAPVDTTASVVIPTSFQEVVDLCLEKSEVLLHAALKNDVHLVTFKSGLVEWRLAPDAPKDLSRKLAALLRTWTGINWVVQESQEGGEPTLYEQEQAAQAAAVVQAANHPSVQSALSAFPDAQIKNVTVA